MRSVCFAVVLLALNVRFFGARVSAADCGIAPRPKHDGDEKVAGGYPSEQWRWPWAAALRGGCSGTLISSRHVLTAGHCYHADKDPKEVYVRVGALNWTGPVDDTWLVAKRVHQHPLYDSNHTFDAEIIEIPPVDTNEYPPICLAANFTETPEEPAFVIGYGGHLNESHTSYGTLYEDYTYLRSASDCSSRPKLQICAGGHRVADMIGDSGGPLMIYRSGRWYEIGVLRAGTGSPEDPPDDGRWHAGNVFTRLSALCEWIEKVTEGEAKCRDIA